MTPKHFRVTTKVVEHIFQKGRFVNSPNLTFKYILNPGQAFVQISCVAPKTVAKSAVKRNLLRRRGYQALKGRLDDFPQGTQGVLVFGKQSLPLFGGRKTKEYNPLTLLEKEIETILHKLN